jgi:uncharacterized protein
MSTVQSEKQRPPVELADHLHRILRKYGPVGVAYSGGVDSAVVAKAAVVAWGNRAVAVTAVSPSLAESELLIARREADEIGIRHVELHTDEFERSEYRSNPTNRCFFCKNALYGLASQRLIELGVDCLVNGANLDDTGDHRPGMRAAALYNVRSPLIEAQMTKADVRRLASFWQLSVADKPASPCLSSRIAYGIPVTEERVRRVEKAEAFLRNNFELHDFRVRVEADELARIEVPLHQLPELVSATASSEISAYFRMIGFRRVTVDLEGFRSGSMNEGMALVQLKPTPK